MKNNFEDDFLLDFFVKGVVEGTLKLPPPLCNKCRDWETFQKCTNSECRRFGVLTSSGKPANCEACGTEMNEYFCDKCYLAFNEIK